MDKYELPPEYDTAEFQKFVEMFPRFWKESYFDFDEFKAYISGIVPDDLQEKYSFTWHGKVESYRLLKRNSHGTLCPCKDDSVDWDTTQNLYIEGDNLEVLKLIKHSYTAERGVKMIYIDPPYNTGEDFIYDDNFMDTLDKYLEYTNQKDIALPETSGRYHTKWLNMMYPRLWLANYLLRDDGVIFISIDDREVANLRKLCDEVFGEENFVGTILWKKKTNGNNMGVIPPVHDYIVVYAKSINNVGEVGYEITEEFIQKTYSNPDNDPRGAWTTMDLSANHKGPYFPITNPATGDVFNPPEGRYWVFNEAEVEKRIADGRIIFGKTGTTRPVQKVFAAERLSGKIRAESWWDSHGMNEDATAEIKEIFGQSKLFTHPKPSKLLYNLAKIATNKDDNDIILDFFSGSATTAHAVMQLNAEDGGNRKFIMVQLPEPCENDSEAYRAGYPNICEVGKERIRRAGAKIAEQYPGVDVGFRVFKLDKSNFKVWDDTPVELPEIDKLHEQMELYADNPFIEGRTHEDIVYEIMRMNNYQLTTPIIPIEINDKTVFGIGEDCDFIVCLDVTIGEAEAEELCGYRPGRILFTDSCFENTETRINVEHTIKNINRNIKLRVV